MYTLILTVVVCILIYSTQTYPDERSIGPYKWRMYSYDGVFPNNSFVVGYENGKKVYIGLNSIAGKVIENRAILEYVQDGKYNMEKKNFWVLTKEKSVKLVWLPVKSGYISIPSRVKPLRVGQAGEKYIGLASFKGRATIGTLHCNIFPDDCEELMAINYFGKVQKFDEFKILVTDV